MKKYSKKIALILALAMTLALAIPALAAQTNISGSYSATGTQVINVAVSGGSTVKAFLNPKGFAANVYENGSDTVIGSLDPSGDITTMPIVGVNMGGSPVKVRAAVTSTLNGNFKFASSAPSQKSTSGLIFLEALALDPAKDVAYNLDYDTAKTGAGRYDDFDGAKVLNVLNNWQDNNDWLNNDLTDSDEKKDFSREFGALKKTNKKADDFRTSGKYLDEIVVLKKGTVESKQQLCTLPTAEQNKTYFIARLSGRLGDGDPTKPGKYWTSNDGFGASIIWTFQTTEPEKDPDASEE